MPEKINIYHVKGFNEWATSYWVSPQGNVSAAANLALDLASLEAPMLHNLVTVNRFEWIDLAGKIVARGSLNVPGTAGGAPLPVRWGFLVNLNASPEFERPSTKYFHGITASWVNGEEAAPLLLSAIDLYSSEIAQLGVLSSDGVLVEGASFAGWTDRRRIGTII